MKKIKVTPINERRDKRTDIRNSYPIKPNQINNKNNARLDLFA